MRESLPIVAVVLLVAMAAFGEGVGDRYRATTRRREVAASPPRPARQ